MKRTPIRRQKAFLHKPSLRPTLKKSELRHAIQIRSRNAETLLAEISRHGLTDLLAERVRAHVGELRPKRRYRKKSEAKSETEALWDLCRKVVLLRDNFECQKCGAFQPTKRPGDYESGPVLHVHHIRSKGAHPALMYELLNLITLCAKCHMPFGNESAHSTDPQPFQDWLKGRLGAEHLEKLAFLAKVRKGQKTDKRLVRVYLESELNRRMGAA